MRVSVPSVLFHSNKYSRDAACEHCSGVIRHESWCITHNPRVRYAYEIVVHPEELTLEDRLILHALGTSWMPRECTKSCSGV